MVTYSFHIHIILLTFIGDVDYLPSTQFLIRNNNHAGLVVQNTSMIRCIGPEGYRIPVRHILGYLHDGPWLDDKSFGRVSVTCCDLNGLGSVV